MLERFLVPLDSNAIAEHVLPHVTLLAKALQQPVVLVSVLADAGHLDPVAHAYDAAIAELQQQRREYAQHYLDGVRDRLAADGIAVTTQVLTGPVAEGILGAASAQHVGLIAMATHGRVGPERWFLGSVADRVVRTASVPVLLVRPRDGEAMPAAFTQIVVPLDGSPLAEAALPYATLLARTFAAPVTLIRTVPLQWWAASGGDPSIGVDGLPPEVLTAIEDDAKEYLARVAERLHAEGLNVSTSFALFRAPDFEITDSAASPGSLVVMTSHGRSGLTRTLLGSVADRVVRSSLAPVLVIRPA
jgi:nucleotide-binding universal stress UspA family protein